MKVVSRLKNEIETCVQTNPLEQKRHGLPKAQSHQEERVKNNPTGFRAGGCLASVIIEVSLSGSRKADSAAI
jgi:hypothetical protein